MNEKLKSFLSTVGAKSLEILHKPTTFMTTAIALAVGVIIGAFLF